MALRMMSSVMLSRISVPSLVIIRFLSHMGGVVEVAGAGILEVGFLVLFRATLAHLDCWNGVDAGGRPDAGLFSGFWIAVEGKEGCFCCCLDIRHLLSEGYNFVHKIWVVVIRLRGGCVRNSFLQLHNLPFVFVLHMCENLLYVEYGA